eukprot:scaffold2299_cov131-Cylindrotheca_fusiformis.AAC.30
MSVCPCSEIESCGDQKEGPTWKWYCCRHFDMLLFLDWFGYSISCKGKPWHISQEGCHLHKQNHTTLDESFSRKVDSSETNTERSKVTPAQMMDL